MAKDLIFIIIAACCYPFVIWAVISSIQMVIADREYWKNEREKDKKEN